MPSLGKFNTFWLVVSSIIVAIDASYVLLLPATAGSESIPYKFWDLYATFDKRYATNEDPFGYLQSLLNVFEITLAMVIVFWDLFLNKTLSFTRDNRSYTIPSTTIPLKLAIIQQMMVFYKTIIYLGLEHFEAYKYTAHLTVGPWLQMVVVPSSFWLIIPAIVIARCFFTLHFKGSLVSSAAAGSRKTQ